MTVLVTGAGGFFGGALAGAFVRAGEDVLAADLAAPGSWRSNGAGSDRSRMIQLDVTERPEALRAQVGTIDGIVHAAAITPSVSQSRDRPDFVVRVNLQGTLNALELTRRSNLGHFLFVSSAAVYDQTIDAVVRESDATGGVSLYGSIKLAAELLVRRYGQMWNLDVGIIRPTSLYGPTEKPTASRPHVSQVAQLVDAAWTGATVDITDPTARCDWVYVDDAAEAAYRFWATGMGGRALNFSSGCPTKFSEVADSVAAVLPLRRSRSGQRISGAPDRPAVISPHLAEHSINWNPRGIRAGVAAIAALSVGGGA